ncbi:MAG: hypothetical protein E6K53_04625 [Gammaproteobacteria bacterium]|nr:MAG: hypothetical protein E6K53_04625 [Gammaproteobacteria bacterium]
MRLFSRSFALAAAVAVCAWSESSALAASHESTALAVPAPLAVHKELGAPPRGVVELKFRDMFKLPVGPRGLQPSTTLSALDGKRVRMIGYMVQQEPLPTAAFLLAPLPVQISDEDEPLADDLPPSTVSVVVPGAETKLIRPLPGLIQITGVLHVGAQADAATGRVSSAQITLDAPLARTLLAIPASTTRAQAHAVRTSSAPARAGVH